MASGNIQIPPPPDRASYKSEWYFRQASDAYYKQWGDAIKAQARAASAGAQADEQAGAEAQRKRQELIDYQNSPAGTAMTLSKSGPAFFAGGIAGGVEANALGRVMTGKGGTVTASPLKRALMYGGYLGLGGVGLGKAWEFDQQSREPRNTPLEADSERAWSNFALGTAAANIGYGGFNALKDIANPEAKTPLKSAADLAPDASLKAPALKALPYAPSGKPREVLLHTADAYGIPYKPKDQSKAILNKLGEVMGGVRKHADLDQAEQILGLERSEVATVAQRREAVMNKLGRLAKGRFALPFALTGAGAMALGSDGAEASPYAPAPGDSAMYAAPSRGERAMNALGRAASGVREAAPSIAAYGLGLPAGLAYDTATGGAGVMSRQQFEERLQADEGRNIRSAMAGDASQVEEMRAQQPHSFPQPLSPQERDALPSSLQRFGNPGANDPRFQAALQEFIAAHAGAR